MIGLTEVVAHYGAGVVFGATLGSRLGAPIPAAPFIVVAGGLAAGGAVNLPLVIGLAALASLIGDAAWFVAGRRYGYRVLRMLCRISMSPDSCVRQSETLIGRWGGSSLIASKFLPGLSVVAAPMAGALGMGGARFIGFEVIASVLWAAAFAGVGVAFGNDIARGLDFISRLGAGGAAMLLLVVAGYLGFRFVRRQASLRDQRIARITVDELADLHARGEPPLIVDVRSSGALDLDPRRLPGAVMVELGRIRSWGREIPHDRRIVTYCNCPNEASASRAARWLLDQGFAAALPLAGGLEGWVDAGHGVDTRPPEPAALGLGESLRRGAH